MAFGAHFPRSSRFDVLVLIDRRIRDRFRLSSKGRRRSKSAGSFTGGWFSSDSSRTQQWQVSRAPLSGTFSLLQIWNEEEGVKYYLESDGHPSYLDLQMIIPKVILYAQTTLDSSAADCTPLNRNFLLGS